MTTFVTQAPLGRVANLLDLINIDDCDVVNKVVDILFSEEQDKDDSEEQVVGDNDEFSLFDLSIEHDMPPPTTPSMYQASASSG